MGRKVTKVYTKEQVEDAARGSFGTYKRVSSKLGCSWHKAKSLINEYPSAKKIFDDEEEYVVNSAKETVYRAVNQGDVKAAQWVLARLHPDKFSENIKVQGTQIINVKFILPDDETDENNKEFSKILKDI